MMFREGTRLNTTATTRLAPGEGLYADSGVLLIDVARFDGLRRPSLLREDGMGTF